MMFGEGRSCGVYVVIRVRLGEWIGGVAPLYHTREGTGRLRSGGQ